MHELFKENAYDFRCDKEQPLIIDCGSYIGSSVLYFKLAYPKSKIIAFEPNDENFKLLSENTKQWNFENVEINNYAIWTENGTVTFRDQGDMSGNITSEATDERNKKIKSVRLKDYLNQPIDFLKIDIEGAEYEVLKDCKENLHFVSNLFFEYHGKFSDGHKLIELLQMLDSAGFVYYIKEAANIYPTPFSRKNNKYEYDVQLNISAFRS